MATVNQVVHGEIPRIADDGSVAAPLVEVITGLMARTPAERMSLMEVRRRIRPLLPEPGTTVFPPDESEADAGPADNKPTTAITPAAPVAPSVASTPKLAADPGPLPWAARAPLPASSLPASSLPAPLAQAPGPLPFARQPAGRGRHPIVTAILLVVAVVLFVAAAGSGFAATRRLAGQAILPTTTTTTTAQATTSVPTAPPVSRFVPTTAQAVVVPDTSGGNFTVLVPQGWVQFVEQRGPQSPLPASTAVRWVKSDGTTELTVERFRDYLPLPTDDYNDALRQTDPKGDLEQQTNAANTVYQFLTRDTDRTMFYEFITVKGDPDLWVVSLTVPLQQVNSGLDLFHKIAPSFQVTG
jgi:hypothetical protein